jgi:predicted regulator of Ras-like GTPase activity (Roadblock/LC7/MglB family)
MSENLHLRDTRLVFYSEDIRSINRLLREFLRLSGAKCVLLIDKEGHMVTKQGVTRSLDIDTISALVAGSFAATQEMARLLGEDEFSVMFHQGKTDNIQLSLVGNRTLLTVIFDEATTIGMVRLYANETSKKLGEHFETAMGRDPDAPHPGGIDEEISSEFGSESKSNLNDVFGI